MYDTIKNIWYGKHSISDTYSADANEIISLHKKHEKMEKDIHTLLPKEGKILFEELTESYQLLIDLLQADAFIKGFQAGGKTLIDVLK